MQDITTLIERIKQNQQTLTDDLDLLKAKEDEQFAPVIDGIKKQYDEISAQIQCLEIYIKNEKRGAK